MNPTMALSQPNATSEDTEIVICRGRAQCKGADTWPCPLCFRVSVSDSWRVEEILPKLQRRDHRVRRGQHQTKESGVTFASIPLVSASYRQKPPPDKGSGTFLPGGRPPVLYMRKGGRSPRAYWRARRSDTPWGSRALRLWIRRSRLWRAGGKHGANSPHWHPSSEKMAWTEQR